MRGASCAFGLRSGMACYRPNLSLPVGLSPLILGVAGGQRLRLPEGRHGCRSLGSRLDLRFGELPPQVCR